MEPSIRRLWVFRSDQEETKWVVRGDEDLEVEILTMKWLRAQLFLTLP